MCVPSVGMSAYCLGAMNGIGAPLPALPLPLPAPLPDGGGVVEVAAPLPLAAPLPVAAPVAAAALGCLAVVVVEGPAALGCELLGVALQRKGKQLIMLERNVQEIKERFVYFKVKNYYHMLILPQS